MFTKSEIALMVGALALATAVDVAGGPLVKLIAMLACLSVLWIGFGWLKLMSD